jgi:hypothetical protein
MWFILWIILSFVVGNLGSKRTIGYGWALFWSLIFSPIIGVIIVLCYPRKEDVEYQERMLAAARRAAEKSELDELIKAKSLLDQGVLSPDEFAKIKFRITGISTSSDENKSSEVVDVIEDVPRSGDQQEANSVQDVSLEDEEGNNQKDLYSLKSYLKRNAPFIIAVTLIAGAFIWFINITTTSNSSQSSTITPEVVSRHIRTGTINTIVDGCDVYYVNIWSSCSDERYKLYHLKNGIKVEIVDDNGVYYKVRPLDEPSKEAGWCMKGFVK